MKAYVYIDGDGVGDKLEGYIINNDLQRAAELSTRINENLKEMIATLLARDVEIFFAGGDNVFACLDLDRELLHRLLNSFLNWTGITASAGVGTTPAEAFLALRAAKALGGGRLIVRGLDGSEERDRTGQAIHAGADEAP